MHELSLLENVLEILAAHANAQHFTKVKKITLEIGKLACIEPDALRFGFAAVMQGSIAENAELTIVEINGLGVCQNCQQQFTMAELYTPCPACGHPQADVIAGMDMKIKELLVN